MKHLFTSESVTEGHPDKICDKISDAVLDAILTKDPKGRVACETLVATGLVLIAGEIYTNTWVNFADVARAVITEIGYTDPQLCFSSETCSVQVALNNQSADIASGVTNSYEERHASATNPSEKLDGLGAGDQGLMFGFAIKETPELMPLPIALAHKLALRLTEVRKENILSYLKPDGKTQVTVQYENNVPIKIDTIVISTQHEEGLSMDQLESELNQLVVAPVLKAYNLELDSSSRLIINPSGRFVIGGPHGDTGLTGRKIIVDTYGGYARHGGGAFSGKDPSKVDRSAAYAARHLAKNVVAAGLAHVCELQVSYAIGMARPVSVSVFTHGTGLIPDSEIGKLLLENFDLRPLAIIEQFDLQNLPAKKGGRFYQDTAAYGHFGRGDIDLPWERLDAVETIKAAASSLKAIR